MILIPGDSGGGNAADVVLIDDEFSSQWLSDVTTTIQWLQVDLGALETISKIVIVGEENNQKNEINEKLSSSVVSTT